MKRKTSSNGKSKALATAKTSREIALPSDLAEEYEKYLTRDQASARAAGWSFINTRGAKFRLGQEELGTDLQAVVLGAIRENVYFEGRFDADNPQGPVCVALDMLEDESKMAPPEGWPTKQNETCLGCPKNAFGTADVGRGKACKNTVRLVLLSWADGNLEQLEKLEGARLRVPVTSVKEWSGYVTKLTKGARRPVFTAVTNIHIEPDPKNQLKVTFGLDSFINDRTTLGILKQRADEAFEHLTQIQMPSEEKAASPQRGAGKTKGLVKRKVTRQRASR